MTPKLLYKGQLAAQTLAAVAASTSLEPTTAAELRHLRAAHRRQAQELGISKKAIAIFADQRPMSWYRFVNQHRAIYPVRRPCQVLGVAPSR